MTAVLSPMKGPIPNVIGLPYGRAPPLHFKAPNWHDMLKLMARMSGTRLEATVEAMAVVKTPMQLRVVVNFVKVRLVADPCTCTISDASGSCPRRCISLQTTGMLSCT